MAALQSSDINIVSIYTLKCNINESLPSLKEKHLDIQTFHSPSIFIKEEVYSIRFNILVNEVYMPDDSKKKAIIGDFEIRVDFKVNELISHLSLEQGKIKSISPKLAITLISIGYSTIRGIVLEKTRGMLGNGLILPIVEPKILLENRITRKGKVK